MTQLDDLKNRILQFMRINEHTISLDTDSADILRAQNNAFAGVLALIEQLESTGKVYRGNDYFPDPVQSILDEMSPQTSLDVQPKPPAIRIVKGVCSE